MPEDTFSPGVAHFELSSAEVCQKSAGISTSFQRHQKERLGANNDKATPHMKSLTQKEELQQRSHLGSVSRKVNK